MAQTVELVLESIGDDYPGLIREALNAKESNVPCSGSLSNSGYAWLIVGRNLYLWKYEPEGNYGAPVVLILPASGIPYNAQTVCVYKRQGFITPGVIAVSPEGIVRHWLMLDSQGSDCSVDLDREVVLSLTRINSDSSDGIHFLLATTTCSFFILSVNLNVAPTPGKRQRFCSDISIKVIQTNARSGIGGKLASAIFGNGKQPSFRLVKALIYEQSDGNTIDRTSITSGFNNLHILAVTKYHLYSYPIAESSKSWSCELAKMASKHFARELWDIRDYDENEFLYEEVITWILDAVSVRNGTLILFACSNKAVSTEIYFALGYISDYDGFRPPTSLEWFTILKSLLNEYRTVDDDALANMALRLPTDSEQGSHDKVEGVLLVTPKSIHSIRLPDLLIKKASFKSILSASYNAKLISSARDAQYCYVFLEEKGLHRARLLPKGFEANLAQSIAEMSKMEMHQVDLSSVTADRRALAKAFYLFSKADLRKAGSVVQGLLENRHIGIAQICTDYAIDLVDDIPNDERWSAVGEPSHSGQISSKSSFLLEVHLEEQKKKILAMFILFLKNVGLDEKLNRTVMTHLSQSRSARSQIVELAEKIDISIALYNWSKQNPSPLFDAAIKRVLSRRKNISEGDLLNRNDYFFREVSRVHELFNGLLEEEEEIIGSDEMLEHKLECVEYISAGLIVVTETIGNHRQENILNIENDLRWAQEKHILMPFLQHLSVIFGCIETAGHHCPKYTTLIKQALHISTFIMSEQAVVDRQNSSIVAKFLEIGEHSAAVELAKRFHDYKTVIRLACALSEVERKDKIKYYRNFFNSNDFSDALHEYYLENGYIKDLLEEKGPEVDLFFATRTNISWMRDIENGEFIKACHNLKALSQESNDNVVLKKRLLSFAKLAALCDEKIDSDILEDIKCDLRVIKHQEKIDPSLIQEFGSTEPTLKVQAYTAEEIIHILLSDPVCNVDQCFNGLLTLSTLLDERNSDQKADVISSLKSKIWLTAIRADKDYWQQVTAEDTTSKTVFDELLSRIASHDGLSNERKLELIPSAEKLIECVAELNHNKVFGVLLRASEEAIRRSIMLDAKQQISFEGMAEPIEFQA